MSELSELNSQHAIPGIVSFEPGEGDLTRIAITTALADAHIYLHGGHVTLFRPRGGESLLFLSTNSQFAPGKAIRGGIPIIFPWFGSRAGDPAAPQHGFARTLPWDVRRVAKLADGKISLCMTLPASDASRRFLPNSFELLYDVTVGPSLELSLHVRNTSKSEIQFEEAFHTYLNVSEIHDVAIEGLAGRSFIDKVDGMKRKVQPPGPLRITGETDRVYLDTPHAVTVADPTGRRLVNSKDGSRSTVVWNPWEAKGRAMSDLGGDQWRRMLCIETANVADNAITLAPGEQHSMRASIAES